MNEYIPTTEEIRNGFIAAEHEVNPHISTDDIQADFDRWLAQVKAEARKIEREHIVDGLQLVAGYVLKPSDYRDGYVQALSDIENDSLPNAPRFIITDKETE